MSFEQLGLPIIVATACLIAWLERSFPCMYIHSNLNVRTGALQYVINGPEMHRWHHATRAHRGDANFATKLAVVFGPAVVGFSAVWRLDSRAR